jgi:hypothetical protein
MIFINYDNMIMKCPRYILAEDAILRSMIKNTLSISIFNIQGGK